MLILRTLGFTCLVSMTTMITMFMWLAFKSKTFFDKGNERYYKATMGNPLNAAFDRSLLTEKGLRWRALIGRVQIVIWLGFVVIALIESMFVR